MPRASIVLGHGMLFDHTLFDPQRALGPEFELVAFDQRSRDERGAQRFSLSDLALDQLGHVRSAAGPVIAGGMSMGGYAALELALAHPGELRGLILISASGLPERSPAEAEAHFLRYRDEPTIPEPVARAEAEAHLAASTIRNRPHLVSLLAEQFARRGGRETWHETLSWSRRRDVSADLAELDLPALIVHGGEDQAVPVAEARRTDELLPRSRLVVVPDCGHAVNLEAPEAVNAAIREFALDATVGVDVDAQH